MGCRYITPEDKTHQEHMGRRIGFGMYADEQHEDVKDSEHVRVCIHADDEGKNPAVSRVIPKNVLSGMEAAVEAPATPATGEAPRRAQRSKRGGK